MRLLSIFFFLISLFYKIDAHASIYPCESNIKAIVFDCDGTLVNNGVAYYLEWQLALRHYGYELDSDQFWNFMHTNKLVGAPGADEKIIQFCCALLDRTDCKEELVAYQQQYSKQLHAQGFPPIQATVDFLKHLFQEKERYGYKIGLASGSSHQNIMRNLHKLRIENYFDVIVSGADDLKEYSDPEGTNKPKPYIYQHVAKLLSVLPEECIAIEDSSTGVSSAVNAGYFVIAIPNEQTKYQDLSKAHLKVETFDALNVSDFIEMVSKMIVSTQL